MCVCENNAQRHLEGVLAVQVYDSPTSRHKLLGVLIEELHQVAPECGSHSTGGADVHLHLQSKMCKALSIVVLEMS